MGPVNDLRLHSRDFRMRSMRRPNEQLHSRSRTAASPGAVRKPGSAPWTPVLARHCRSAPHGQLVRPGRARRISGASIWAPENGARGSGLRSQRLVPTEVPTSQAGKPCKGAHLYDPRRLRRPVMLPVDSSASLSPRIRRRDGAASGASGVQARSTLNGTLAPNTIRRLIATALALQVGAWLTAPEAGVAAHDVRAFAARTVYLPKCGNSGYGGAIRPRSWSPGCAGASPFFKRLRWTRWGSVATGRGRVLVCPSYRGCSTYRGRIRAYRIRPCEGKQMFTRTRLTVGGRTYGQPLVC